MKVSLSQTPVLETERLILRAPKASDWPLWRDYFRTERSRFNRPGDTDDEKSWRAFGHFIGHWVLHGFGSFVITWKGNDTPIGSCGPWFPYGWPEREIGWMIWSQDNEGKSVAYEGAQAARNFAFDTLGWDTAVSYIVADNPRSIALAERLGATQDPSASTPGDVPCFVYRHRRPA